MALVEGGFVELSELDLVMEGHRNQGRRVGLL